MELIVLHNDIKVLIACGLSGPHVNLHVVFFLSRYWHVDKSLSSALIKMIFGWSKYYIKTNVISTLNNLVQARI